MKRRQPGAEHFFGSPPSSLPEGSRRSEGIALAMNSGVGEREQVGF